MSATNYSNCLAITLDYEGGYSNDPGDPGGPTKYGITIHDVRLYLKPQATEADVKALTLNEAKTIYRRHYWEPVAGDGWPDGLDLAVFDAGVNSGVGRALTWARATLTVSTDGFEVMAARARAQTVDTLVAWIKSYNARRLSFLHALRTWSLFGRGWGRRVAGIEALGVKMALQAKQSPSEVKKKLEQEAGQAKTQAKKNGGGAAGTGTAGGGAATQVDWSQVDGWLIALAVAAVVAAIIYFIWWTNHHAARAQAYAKAAQSV